MYLVLGRSASPRYGRAVSAITAEQFLNVLHTHMPDTRGLELSVQSLTRGEAVLRLGHDERRLRPGGTISGPTLFMFADLGLYLVTMSLVGLQPLAVTTDLTMHFLRKPAPRAMICHARVIKAGKRLVVGEATLTSEGEPEPIAHIIGSYSVPPG